MRRALALVVLLGACKGGLPVDKGNDFPCDFTKPEQERDEACSPGEVCGVDNLCRHFQYEGPQFEGPPSVPEYDQSVLLHPLVFDRPVRAVAAEASGKRELVVALGPAAGGSSLRVDLSPALKVTPTVAVPEGTQAMAWGEKLDRSVDLFAVTDQTAPRTSTDLWRDTLSFEVRDSSNVRFDDGRKLRAGPAGLVVLRATAMVPPVFKGGELSNPYVVKPANGLHLEVADLQPTVPAADGGTLAADPLEARYVPRIGLPNREELLVLSSQGFFLRTRAGGSPESWRLLSLEGAPGFDALALTAPSGVSLRHDSSGSLWAFSRPQRPVDQRQQVLSVWSLARSGQPTMARAWTDCSPCREGHIVSFAPRLNGAPSVEVVCATGLSEEGLVLVEVVGSAAPDSSQDCLTRSAAPAFALNELNRSGLGVVEDQSVSGQVILGGKHGQLWGGESFSTAYPFTLERVPQAFGTLQLDDGTVVPVALTDRYPAAPLLPGIGFQAFNLQRTSDSPLPPDVAARAMVGLAQGWLVLSTGDVAQLQSRVDDGGVVASKFRMQFGPRLVDARGAPARAPFFGEGVRDFADGGLVSMVLAADDSLYLLPVPQTTPSPETLPPVTPQLTPEPGSPIRSFALERSTVGTDGINKVRGYVVTSRSLYTVQLSGTPARWSATPVLLAGGEPVETWMDHPLGGLGRVGYRDGQVFTLPGGFLLVNPLPKTDGGVAVQVTDYENLAGWPVAMATSGLYVAEYGLTDAGRLDNKFEDGTLGKAMTWREVSLTDGGRPWLGEAARLQVVPRGVQADLDAGVAPQEVFSLFVYTGQQVWQVAQLKRRCTNCAALSP